MGFKISAKVSDAERHLNEIACVLLHKAYLYSGAEDGIVKVWSLDLKLVNEVNAHPVNVYSIAASDDTLYTCSNDGTIKAWSLDTLKLKKTLIESSTEETLRLLFADGKLYSGDDKGNVYVWENDERVGRYETGEEIWDILVHGNFLFTVRNMDVAIIEMKPGGKQYTFVTSIDGRSPLKRAGNHFCFMDRTGKVLNIHELSKESKFKATASLNAHEMIVNALCGVDQPQAMIFSGGYDKEIKRWDVASQTCTDIAAVGGVVSAMAATCAATVYASIDMGYIIKVDFH